MTPDADIKKFLLSNRSADRWPVIIRTRHATEQGFPRDLECDEDRYSTYVLIISAALRETCLPPVPMLL